MGLKAAIISLGSVSSKWTFERMKNYFEVVDDINLKEVQVTLGKNSQILYKGEPMKDYDCVFVKGSFKYAMILRSITTMLAGKCFMPFKASAFTVGHNKILTQLKIQQAGIPTPTTYLVSSIAAAKKTLESLKYPLIIKFPEGTQGKGVMFAESYASASSMLDAFESLKQPVLIQEYIETNSTDTRVIVCGDKVVGAMQRKAEMGEKRANIHTGGTGESVELDLITKNIAIKTAKAMNCGHCAVDILEGPTGPHVIEINLSPGLQGITKATKIDIADAIAKYLYEETKNFKKESRSSGTNDILKDLGISSNESKSTQEIITSVDMRGQRMLLPSVATKLSSITDDDEIIIRAVNGKIDIEKI